jgi:hypothetical protein
MGEYVE